MRLYIEAQKYGWRDILGGNFCDEALKILKKVVASVVCKQFAILMFFILATASLTNSKKGNEVNS